MKHLTACALAMIGCGSPSVERPEAPEPEGPPGTIVTTQRGPRGGHLVFVDDRGRTVADLTRTGLVALRDNSAAWSPRGDWVAFASSRGRDLVETSLWVVPAEARAEPRRLTDGDAVQHDPTWGPDGEWLVYASRAPGADFDLFRARVVVADGRMRIDGDPVPLTDEAGQELYPSVAPDRSRIAYMAIDEEGTSQLRVVDWDGGDSRALTEGPVDLTPSWSPDGGTIAFASRPEGRADFDLYLLDVEAGERRLLLREPLADQTGPAWSKEGRYVFCTSVYRSVESGDPLTSSVTFVDLRQERPTLYALHDPVAVENRTGATLAPRVLDAAALHRNSSYGEALRAWMHEIMRRRPELQKGVEELFDEPE